MASVFDLITQGAEKHGLSAEALLAVVLGEGGLNFVNPGDAGTSHGPFQLRGNDAPGGGASPFGVAETRRRAEAKDPFIVNEPLRQIAALGIGNLTPEQQVENIIRRFERPADPDKSVANALARLSSGEVAKLLEEGGLSKKDAKKAATEIFDENKPDLSFIQSLFKEGDEAQLEDPKQELLRLMLEGPLESEDLIRISMQKRQFDQDQRTSAEVAAAEELEGPSDKRAPTTNTTSGPSKKEWGALKGTGNTTVKFMLKAIKKAQDLGLSVRENPFVDPVDDVHTEGSFHDKNFPGTVDGKRVGRGLDVSGQASAMDAFFRWAIKFRPTELFYDPLGQYDNGRYSSQGIGKHDTHVHLSV